MEFRAVAFDDKYEIDESDAAWISASMTETQPSLGVSRRGCQCSFAARRPDLASSRCRGAEADRIRLAPRVM